MAESTWKLLWLSSFLFLSILIIFCFLKLFQSFLLFLRIHVQLIMPFNHHFGWAILLTVHSFIKITSFIGGNKIKFLTFVTQHEHLIENTEAPIVSFVLWQSALIQIACYLTNKIPPNQIILLEKWLKYLIIKTIFCWYVVLGGCYWSSHVVLQFTWEQKVTTSGYLWL